MAVFYDLIGADGLSFSPNTWRSRLALAHTGFAHDVRGIGFTDIPSVCGGQHKTVPILELDDSQSICGSDLIADYLEEQNPGAGLLGAGRSWVRFYEAWALPNIAGHLLPMLAHDIHDHLQDKDKEYFRTTREKRLGKTLEEAAAGREERLGAFSKSLMPARMRLAGADYLGGDQPNYMDHILVSYFQWARAVSTLQIIGEDDKLWPWLQRMLDQYDGILRQEKSYWG